LVCCSFDRAFADDRALVPPAARRFELAENALEQPALEQPVGLGRELVSLLAALQTLLLGKLAR